jgi:DNA-binding NtrC family response regulator
MFDMPKTLLIVDDDISILTFLSQHLSDLGYGVRSVKDGTSALSEIENELPDILLSDIDLPGIPGARFLSTVRRKFPSIRVVAMSGAYSGRRVPAGITADAFYEKGSNLHLLTQVVDAMTRPGRSTIRLATEGLFGFQVFENIPSHPSAERPATSTERSIVFLLPRRRKGWNSAKGRRDY